MNADIALPATERPDGPPASGNAGDAGRARWRSAGWGLVYLAAMVVANVATSHLGLTPAGFGLRVTAGTWTAAIALTARDRLQDTAGPRIVLLAIVVGAGVSALDAAPRIAGASALTGIGAELADLAAYTPLRAAGRTRLALVCSNTAGAVVDTLVFLPLAGFGWAWPTVVGQLLVKVIWVTGGWLAAREVIACVVSRQRVHTEHP